MIPLETLAMLGMISQEKECSVEKATVEELDLAKTIQQFVKQRFDEAMNSEKKLENIYKGMEVIELKLKVRGKIDAGMQVHKFKIDNFGYFTKIGPSSGLVCLIPQKLYYIIFVIGKTTI